MKKTNLKSPIGKKEDWREEFRSGFPILTPSGWQDEDFFVRRYCESFISRWKKKWEKGARLEQEILGNYNKSFLDWQTKMNKKVNDIPTDFWF